MGEIGVWVEKYKTLLQKKNQILRYGEKGCATYGRNRCLGGGIKDSAPKKEPNSEIWGRGVRHIGGIGVWVEE